MKGTGFSPYIKQTNPLAFSPEGVWAPMWERLKMFIFSLNYKSSVLFLAYGDD
jgi:hypothetical protein